MSNKKTNGMHKLRRKMVINFLSITFVASVLSALLDGVFEWLASKLGENEKGLIAAVILLLFFQIGIYVISGYVFYRRTKREIQKESDRQVNEQNLLYAAIAHDLKTPMTSVQGYAKALKEGKIRAEEQEEIYDIIYNKSKTMNSLVDTLFEYAKFGTKEYKLVFEKTNLSVIIRDIIAENYCDFEEHNIDIDIDIPEEEIIVNADKRELKRAITNLVMNTYKHNPDGIQVLVRLLYDGANAELTIADSGNEIPEDINVFEPFVTENISRSVGKGTGLGLAITKRILDQHDAEISIRNDIQGYTKAFVILFKNA